MLSSSSIGLTPRRSYLASHSGSLSLVASILRFPFARLRSAAIGSWPARRELPLRRRLCLGWSDSSAEGFSGRQSAAPCWPPARRRGGVVQKGSVDADWLRSVDFQRERHVGQVRRRRPRKLNRARAPASESGCLVFGSIFHVYVMAVAPSHHAGQAFRLRRSKLDWAQAPASQSIALVRVSEFMPVPRQWQRHLAQMRGQHATGSCARTEYAAASQRCWASTARRWVADLVKEENNTEARQDPRPSASLSG